MDVSQIDAKIEDFKMDIQGAIEAFNVKKASSDFVILTGLKTRHIKGHISKRAVADKENEPTKNMIQVFGKNCAAVFNKIYLVDNTDETKKGLVRPLFVADSEFICDDKTST